MSAVDLAQFHQVFFEESLEGLDAMEAALLELDSGSEDPELVHTIFRAAHSIKGGSATFGFSDVAAFTHVAESLLEEVRSGRRAVDADITDLLLRSVDCLREMLARSRAGEPAASEESEALRSALAALVEGGGPALAAKAEAVAPAVAGWEIRFRPLPHLLKTGNDPVRLFRELDGMGRLEVVAVAPRGDAVPTLEQLDPSECVLGWHLRLHGDVKRAALDGVFDWLDGDCELEIEPLPAVAAEVGEANVTAEVAVPAPTGTAPAAPGEAKPAPGKAAAAHREGADASTIRVSIPKIDALINMVGELVITQSMLSQIGEVLEGDGLESLRDGLSQLERNTRELQESVMGIRMLPIGSVFSRFPRLVRDLERKLGKQVNLELHGKETELDKTVMEKIGDPLVHLVRNAIDHGLEAPDKRVAAGKSETGTIRLNAFHEGGNIVVEVRDDGAGLNRDAIVAKAVQRGIIGSAEGMSEEEINELIFQPGFSTAAQTTDLSGRGVGMDVVRRNVNDLGGSVRVSSRPGKGSTFTIVLPLTLAIIDGLATAVGGERYIVPLISIVESMQLKPDQIRHVAGGGEMFRFRDGYLPVVRLHSAFGCENAITDIARGIVVVVEAEGRRIGLLVDELLGQQQAVVKSLEQNYRRIAGISGATILGDGSVALIVDVTGVMRVAGNRRAA